MSAVLAPPELLSASQMMCVAWNFSPLRVERDGTTKLVKPFGQFRKARSADMIICSALWDVDSYGHRVESHNNLPNRINIKSVPLSNPIAYISVLSITTISSSITSTLYTFAPRCRKLLKLTSFHSAPSATVHRQAGQIRICTHL